MNYRPCSGFKAKVMHTKTRPKLTRRTFPISFHTSAEFSVLSMPFAIARVRNYYGGETGQAKIVRDAQVRIADSTNNVAWFDTDDCSMQDEGHYDEDGLETIGRRFAKHRESINKQ